MPPSRTVTSTSAAAEAARTTTACTSCRDRKIKCSGTQPCRYCVNRHLTCVFPPIGKKKLYTISYVEALERQAASVRTQQGQNIATGQHSHSRSLDAPSLAYSTSPILPLDDGTQQASQSEGEVARNAPVTPAIELKSAMSSSLEFGSHIKGIATQSTVQTGSPGTPFQHPQLIVDNVYNLNIQQGSRPIRSEPSLWPLEDIAYGLLSTLQASVGKLQHLIDPRMFSDRLSRVYAEISQLSELAELDIVQVLMVFALGELLQGNRSHNAHLPGSKYFEEAIRRVPDLFTLRSSGSLGIECMALIAFYCQCADSKDNAYLYASTALRLAISHGLARGGVDTRLTKSEKVHQNRLWWTVYMQERRLAAAVGQPLAIQDDAISARLPQDSPGFDSVAALNINIQLANITGRIMLSIYGPKNQTGVDLVTNVQIILSAIHNVMDSMPLKYALDFSQLLHVSRISATLHLMLYQATVLATRPFLLHLAKARFHKNDELIDQSGALQMLSHTCFEAATRSLQILEALRQQQLLAIFGFFDLDAIFSSGFVFVLGNYVFSTTTEELSIACLGRICDLLDHLEHRGNAVASKRREDIEQMCAHLNLNCRQTESTDINRFEMVPTGVETETALDGGYLPWLNDNSNDLSLDDSLSGMGDFSFNFNLTGAAQLDWEELERQTTQA